MKISTKDWLNYIGRLRKLNETAADKMQKFIQLNGFGDTQAIIDYGYGLATKYGEGAGALAAEMYDIIAELEKQTLPAAEIAATASYADVAKTVNGILKTSNNDKIIAEAIGRLVKRAGQDTTLKNALRDGAEAAWVPVGDTCAFCIALASRGYQKVGKNTLKNGHAEHIHSNCDCAYSVRFRDTDGVDGYNPEYYYQQYASAEGGNSKEKINAMRRRYYAENKERINAQKRDAYERRKELNAPDAEELDVN